jgi:hypothetical protein
LIFAYQTSQLNGTLNSRMNHLKEDKLKAEAGKNNYFWDGIRNVPT